MQRHLFSLLLLAVALTSIVSCSSDKKGIAIPKDASFALHVNVKSLTSKVSWQEIQQNEWFKEAYANEADSFARKILQDPANSGIDLQGDLGVFVKKQNQGGYVAAEGGIKDPAAFETFATNANKGGKVVKTGDVSVLNTGLKSLVAWTSSRFVFISDVPMPSLSNRFNSSSSDGNEPFSFTTDSLQKFAVELFDLPSKNNLMSDDRFLSVMKEPGDIHYWVNAEQYYNSLGGMLSLLKVNVLFEGNAYGAALNFDNGKITFKTKAFVNKDLKALMEKNAGGKISADMINRIPSKNVVAVFAFKYQPQGFLDLLKLIGVDGMVNGFLGGEGYSTAEFAKATKGDVLLAVSDLKIKGKTAPITNPDGSPSIQEDILPVNILFATSVNEKPSFDKLFSILQKKSQGLQPITNNIHFQLNNEWFAASNSPEQVNAFLSGGNNNFAFTNRIAGKSFGGYIDIQGIMRSLAPVTADSSAKAMLDLSLNTWQDVVMTSGGQKDDAFVGEVEINLVDKNTNSLKQLNKYLDTMGKISGPKHNHTDAQVRYTDPAAAGLAALEPVLHR
jgi:hypothetical protein